MLSSANGLVALETGMALLKKGTPGSRLDAIVETVAIVEADPNDDSVGYGGLPNADGRSGAGLLDHGRPVVRRRRGRGNQEHQVPVSCGAARDGTYVADPDRRRWRATVRCRARLQGREPAHRSVP
jgi:hypothetical protein